VSKPTEVRLKRHQERRFQWSFDPDGTIVFIHQKIVVTCAAWSSLSGIILIGAVFSEWPDADCIANRATGETCEIGPKDDGHRRDNLSRDQLVNRTIDALLKVRKTLKTCAFNQGDLRPDDHVIPDNALNADNPDNCPRNRESIGA
jgi:hypothetical protein